MVGLCCASYSYLCVIKEATVSRSHGAIKVPGALDPRTAQSLSRANVYLGFPLERLPERHLSKPQLPPLLPQEALRIRTSVCVEKHLLSPQHVALLS